MNSIDPRIQQLSYQLESKGILIDSEDLELVCSFNSWAVIGNKAVACNYNGKTIYLHRVIMNCPAYAIVDHVNGNILDNRKVNLRLTHQTFNVCNKRVSATKKSKLPK